MPDDLKDGEVHTTIAPVIPRDPVAGHSGLVVDCPPHALPFGVIFEEYAARRGGDLKQNASEVLGVEADKALSELRHRLIARDGKYYELQQAKANPQTPASAIDDLERACYQLDRPLKRLLHKMNGSALCLSGGGIRSASFGLGVLEGLARFSVGLLSPAQGLKHDPHCEHQGLLHSLDYLSTVSGGGYIGSWLTAWIYRRRTAATLKASSLESSYGEVVNSLAGESNLTSGDPAPQPVRHLREYTSYLAPAMGLSLDSWDLAAIVSRNLLVNWIMLAPLFLVVVAAPQVSYHITHDVYRIWPQVASWLILGLVLILFLIAAIFSGRALPSHRSGMNAGPKLGLVVLGFAGPVLLANWTSAQLWNGNEAIITLSHWRWPKIAVFLVSYAGFATLAILLFLSYRRRILRSIRPEIVRGRHGLLRFVLMQGAALLSAWVTAELMGLLAGHVLPALESHTWTKGFTTDDRLYTVLALPLVTLVPLFSHSLFTGLLGIFEQEEDREWLSRAGAIQVAFITAWVVAHAVSLYAPDALNALRLAACGAVLGGIGSALGWSGATSAGPRPIKTAQLSKVGSFLSKHDLLLPALCAIALLLLTLGAAGAEYKLAGTLAQSLASFLANYKAAMLITHLIILVAAAGVALLANWAINVNLFSLHGMYRMRLMRAFLGASNTQRYPDSFTQFDPKDSPDEIDLPKGAGAPLHLINTTLNLVGTKNLAWRQRKAASFTFSSLHSGSWRLAYVPTKAYAGADGVSLATAMAISGAAFNPNMGYHSSPLVTLLMTFFNVRLGWWLPNPSREEGARWPWVAKGSYFLHKTGPTIALEPLILEAFGMTDDTYRWIELTDGGHFENLGLYEMVLRRCHNIVVVDAGADPECQFEDLGNALRKIEIDLGIPIRFKKDDPNMKAGAKPGNRYCAVATIDYGCVDDCQDLPESERANLAGTLIYIKASMTGAEPPDIRQYAMTHSTFPHETTANQFFNESQFESYRHLGSFVVETIVNEGSLRSPLSPNAREVNRALPADIPTGVDFDSFVKAARRYTASTSPSP